MALSFTRFPKYTESVIFIRLMTHLIKKQKCFNFSTTKILAAEKGPIKYTTHNAAKVPIAETIGVYSRSNKRRLWYEPYVIIACLITLLGYFCVLREENDIDEILKGNSEYLNYNVELINLKTKLKYCETHHLPTEALRAKIEKLEENLKHNSPFRM